MPPAWGSQRGLLSAYSRTQVDFNWPSDRDDMLKGGQHHLII